MNVYNGSHLKMARHVFSRVPRDQAGTTLSGSLEYLLDHIRTTTF